MSDQSGPEPGRGPVLTLQLSNKQVQIVHLHYHNLCRPVAKFMRACAQKKSRITRQCLKTLDHKRKLAQILNSHIFVWSSEYSTVLRRTSSLEEMDMIVP